MKTSVLASSLLVAIAAMSGCVSDAPESGAELESTTSEIAPYASARADLRIAVIGAGPSGLTAAYTLKELGYTNVTVFEKEDHAGGKVSSLNLLGQRAELGAVFASPDYRVVLDIANKVGVPYAEYTTTRYVLNERNEKQTFDQFLTSRYTPEQIVEAVRNYAAVLQRFPEIDQDGFAGLHPDLYMTFDRFAAKYGFTPVAEMARSLVVGFGYSYYETMPAIYPMKLIPWLVKVGPDGLYSPPYFVFPTGYQSVWTELAKQLNVRLNSAVTRIERSSSNGPVRLTINNNIFDKKEFDAVIMSAPLSVMPKLMSLTSHEKALFAKVETSRYFVTLFTAANVPGGETVFSHGAARPSGINHLVAWGNPGSGVPVYIGYQLADRSISSALVTAILALDVATMAKGLFIAPLVKKEWPDYFPRVNPAAMAAGFFEDLEALQGQRGIFYVGSNLSFETVEHTARFAQSLVRERFPRPTN